MVVIKNFFCVRFLALLVLLYFYCISLNAQYTYGTTGLLHAPTAEMQKDKTFLFGGSFINKNVTSGKWRFNTYTYNTFNYYVDLTLFPWLEVSYNLTLNQGIPNSKYWPKRTWKKFSNQDRSFHVRIRVWEEGAGNPWAPQVVIGANDPATHTSYGGGSISMDTSDEGGTNNYHTRWYIAATKHLIIDGVGNLGAHFAFNWGRARREPEYILPSMGANFQFDLPVTDDLKINKYINGLNLMAEICPKPVSLKKAKEVVNFGLSYSIYKDNINLLMEMNECKYFSGGIYFKLHLR